MVVTVLHTITNKVVACFWCTITRAKTMYYKSSIPWLWCTMPTIEVHTSKTTFKALSINVQSWN